jgi:hypothetical protein
MVIAPLSDTEFVTIIANTLESSGRIRHALKKNRERLIAALVISIVPGTNSRNNARITLIPAKKASTGDRTGFFFMFSDQILGSCLYNSPQI